MRETWSDEPLGRLRALAREGGRAAQSLPGAEVRALGARRRRRRTAATAGAVVMAVVVVAGGAFAALDRLGSPLLEPTDPSPTMSADPSPTRSTDPSPTEPAGPLPTVIPSDYEIDRDLPDPGGDGDVQGPSADVEIDPFLVCELNGWLGTAAVTDQVGARSSGPADDNHVRLVRLYSNAEEADAVVLGLSEVLGECYDEQPEGDTVVNYSVERTTLGDNSVMALTSYDWNGLPTLGMEQMHVIRVGAAVLIVGESGEYLPGSDVVQTWIDDLTGMAQTMADDLRACLEHTSCPAR